MMSRKRLWPFNSIRTILLASVLIIALPLVGMLIYNNFYAIHVVRDQVADSYKSSLTIYMDQIDSDLNDIDAYLITIANKHDLLALSVSQTEDDYYLAKLYLKNVLSRDVALYRSIDGFFVYAGKRQDYMEVINYGPASNGDLRSVENRIIEVIEQQRKSGRSAERLWHDYEINNQHYLIDIVSAGDAYLGVWVNTDQLIEQLKSLEVGDQGEILLVNDQGEAITRSTIKNHEGVLLEGDFNRYYMSGEGTKYLIVGSHAMHVALSLVALIPDQHILANLPYLTKVIWLITIVALLFIPLGVFVMRRAFLAPLNRILSAMRRVRDGDWGVRVDVRRNTEEINLLGDSFNSMMTEIQTLRVNVFEEQLSKQSEELRRLQLQINPHFFLNALNIVYNLAKIKDYGLIKEMTMSLVQYFRYLFRSNTSFVILQNELDHTRNYLQIQKMRFPGQLTWIIEAPNYLMEKPIPPLIIQSIVENSIKHAITLDEPIEIKVTVELLDIKGEARLVIQISDNGIGFSDEVLQELQLGRSVENEDGEHIGIWNVQRRLDLLYGDKAMIQYSNDYETGGAVVRMILPIMPDTEELL